MSVEVLDENGEFPDPHGSYMVEEGDECVVPDSLRGEPGATTTTVPAASTTSTNQPGTTTTTLPARDRSPVATVPPTTVPPTTVPPTTVPATTGAP